MTCLGKALFIPAILLSILFSSISHAEDRAHPLAATWSGAQKVTVRYRAEGEFRFLAAPDSVDLRLTVGEDGRIDGRLGSAVFADCGLRSNRGWLGRTLNLKTDYIIRGRLLGAIFPNDPYHDKEISFPFNAAGGKISGSLFHLQGRFALYPLASPGDLVRE